MNKCFSQRRRTSRRLPPNVARRMPVELLESRVLLSTITWANTGSDWNTGSNWVGGAVPTAADIAVFPSAASAINPNLAQATSVGGVTIDNSGADYSITQSGTCTLTVGSGGITVVTPSSTTADTTTIAPNIAWSNSQTWTLTNNTGITTLNTTGSLSDGGYLTLAGNGVLNVHQLTLASTYVGLTIGTGVSLNAGSGASLTAAPGSVLNDGTLNLAGATVNLTGGGYLDNAGTLNATAGTSITVSGGYFATEGTLNLTDTAVTESDGGWMYLNGGLLEINAGASITIGEAGLLANWSAAAVMDINPGGVLEVDGGTVQNQSTIDVNGGAITLNSGTLSTSAELIVNTDGAINQSGGTLDVAEGGYLGSNGNLAIDGSTLTIDPGAELDIADGTITLGVNSWASIYNNGVMNMTGGFISIGENGTVGGWLGNNATMNVSGGSIDLAAGWLWNAGTMEIGTATVLITATASTGNQGTLTVNDGGYILIDSNAYPGNYGGSLNVNTGGYFEDATNFYSTSSPLAVNTGGTLRVDAGAALVTDNTFTVAAGGVFQLAGTIQYNDQTISADILSVSGAAAVAEDGQYALDLSALVADIPAAVQSLSVDWGDGSAPAVLGAADLTEATTLNHVFSSGTSFSNVLITAATVATDTLPSFPLEIAQVPVDIVPAAPSDLSATVVSSSEVDLTWINHSQAEEGFTILRSDDGGTTFNPIGYADADATSYSDSGLDASTTYQYQVQATGGAEGDQASLAATSQPVTTMSGVPALTAKVVPNDTNTGSIVTLSWSCDGNNVSGFELESKLDGPDVQTPFLVPRGSIKFSIQWFCRPTPGDCWSGR